MFVLALIGIAVGIAFGSSSVAATATAESEFIHYSGELTTTYFDAESSDANVTLAERFGIECGGDRCLLVGVRPEHYRDAVPDVGLEIRLDGGHAVISQVEGTGYPCIRDLSQAPGVLVVDATGTDISVTWTIEPYECAPETQDDVVELVPIPIPIEPVPIEPVPNDSTFDRSGRARLISASHSSTLAPQESFSVIGFRQEWTGTYIAGDPCLVDSASCPPSETTEAATPLDGEASTPSASAAPSAGAVAPEGDSVDPSPTPTEDAGPPAVEDVSSPPPPTWSTPSKLSTLAQVTDAGIAPAQLGLAAALALILVLLVAGPTALLNSAVERATGSKPRIASTPSVHLSGWWKAGLAVLAAGIISSFIDPEFGLNAQGGRIAASLLIAFAIEVALGWSVLIWVVRRANPGTSAWFNVKPWTLLIVAGAVILTRITDFRPGIVFGLVAGVAFGTAITMSERAPAELFSLGYAFAIAILAWLAYSTIGLLAVDPESDGLVFLKEVLAALAIAGVAALPVVLVPLHGLPGYAVFRWHPIVWGGAYFIALFTFFVILMPMPFSWLTVPMPLMTWVGIYLAYAVLALATWLIIRIAVPKEGRLAS